MPSSTGRSLSHIRVLRDLSASCTKLLRRLPRDSVLAALAHPVLRCISASLHKNAVWASGTHTQSSMAERAFRSHWTTPRADRVPASRAAGCRERPAKHDCRDAGGRATQEQLPRSDSGRAPERPRLEGSPQGQGLGSKGTYRQRAREDGFITGSPYRQRAK
jgi:hypothetical protein